MESLWSDLSTRKLQGALDRDEERFFKKLVKVLGFLAADPKHNSLASHEITELSRRHGFKAFQSYLENRPRVRGGSSGRMGRTRRISLSWLSRRILKTGSAELTNASNLQTCHRFNPRRGGKAEAEKRGRRRPGIKPSTEQRT